jgi:hypothetical protein
VGGDWLTGTAVSAAPLAVAKAAIPRARTVATERLVERLIAVDGIHHTLLLITCLEKFNLGSGSAHKRDAEAAKVRLALHVLDEL